MHKDSIEHFDDFRRRKSRQNDDFRGRFYALAEFTSLGAENEYCLTIFGAENRAKMTNLMRWPIWCYHIVPRDIVLRRHCSKGHCSKGHCSKESFFFICVDIIFFLLIKSL